jgi:hypothetical protein
MKVSLQSVIKQKEFKAKSFIDTESR